MTTYLAVVKQPACYNVFWVTARGGAVRLKQSTGAECVAFAEGYKAATTQWAQFDIEVKYFQCEAGDAATMEWKGLP